MRSALPSQCALQYFDLSAGMHVQTGFAHFFAFAMSSPFQPPRDLSIGEPPGASAALRGQSIARNGGILLPEFHPLERCFLQGDGCAGLRRRATIACPGKRRSNSLPPYPCTVRFKAAPAPRRRMTRRNGSPSPSVFRFGARARYPRARLRPCSSRLQPRRRNRAAARAASLAAEHR